MTKQVINSYFINCTTIIEVNAIYRSMCKKLHPDTGGSTEAMQLLNEARENFIEKVKSLTETKKEIYIDWRTSQKGNHWARRNDGSIVTIFKTKHGTYGIVCNDMFTYNYRGSSISTIEEAKKIAYEKFFN